MKHLKVYCRESSIHGLPYLVSNDIHWAEKVFWLLALITSGLCCGAMIAKIAVKVQEDAIVTYTSDTAINITKVPFIAVTFCPDLLTHNEYFDYNLITNALVNNEIAIENVTLDELKFMQVIALIHNDDFLLQFNVSIDTKDVLTYIRNMTFDWSKNYRYAHFDDRFAIEYSEIIGPYGFCYTFNIIEANDLFELQILPEVFNYSRPIKSSYLIRKYRRRPYAYKLIANKPARVSNYRSGFTTINTLHDYGKKQQIDENHHKSQIEDGSRYLFHSPYDLFTKSSVRSQYRSKISFAQQYFIEPKLKILDKSLENAQISKRGCYLENEKTLKFFKMNTKSNCQAECLANRTLETCSCVQFFMVRERHTRICGIADMKCFKNVEELEHEKDSCDCYPECDEISYTIEQRQMEFVRMKNYDTFEYHKSTRGSQILVLFKSPEFYPVIFQRSFALIDLVSYTGGTLGLFLGFSVLAFIEIGYYFTLRVLFDFLGKTKVADQDTQIKKSNSKTLNYFKSFLKQSSIHGMNQIVLNRRNSFERILWALLVLTSLIYSGIAARDIYLKYANAPILFSLDDNPILKEQIPFPAITFSNEVIFNKTYRTQLIMWQLFMMSDKEILETLTNMGIFDEFVLKGMLSNVNYLIEMQFRNISPTENLIGKIKDLSQIDWFKNQTALWNSRYQPEFIQIPTRAGFGFAFNMLPPSKLFTKKISKDFSKARNVNLSSNGKNVINFSLDNYPLNAFNSEGNKLKIVLSKNFAISSQDIGKYWMFTVHSPYDLASSYDEIETCEFYFGYDLDVLITPEVIYTDPDLRKYSPEKRKCYFPGEKKLKFFKVYTRKNCEFECLSNVFRTLRPVNCTPFYAVRKDSYTLCDIRNQLNVTFYKFEFDQNVDNLASDCKCLDECDSVKYKFEIIAKVRADYNTTDNQMDRDTNVTLTFRMKDENVFPLRRSQPFTFNEFIAQSGGLMGLFAAISALSIFEVFYFFPLRAIANLWRKIA